MSNGDTPLSLPALNKKYQVDFSLISGELGWEFYVKNDQATALYDAIMSAGQKHGIGHIGSYAVNSMRLEKGFRLWGAEVPSENMIQNLLCYIEFYCLHFCVHAPKFQFR